MSKHLAYKAGIFLNVVSWENDGDHYQTHNVYVDTLEEAQALYHLCANLLRPLGNSFYDEDEAIEEYRLSSKYYSERYTRQSFKEWVAEDISGRLLGYSEHYRYRVFESCKILQTDENMYLNLLPLEGTP